MKKYEMYIKKKSKSIYTVDEWGKIASPKKKDIHWKDGRSAKELARYITNSNGYLPIEIEKVLDEINFNENVSFIGEPEAVTSLIGKGEGRNHDLLLNGKNKIIIGIEAKADEYLGNYVSKELTETGISENKIKRIKSLYKDVYGTEDLEQYNPRYQLLTATVGTLIEAEKVHADKCVLLIISFLRDKKLNNNKVETNKSDIKYFKNSINKFMNGDKYNLSGYKDIDFYFKSLYIS